MTKRRLLWAAVCLLLLGTLFNLARLYGWTRFNECSSQLFDLVELEEVAQTAIAMPANDETKSQIQQICEQWGDDRELADAWLEELRGDLVGLATARDLLLSRADLRGQIFGLEVGVELASSVVRAFRSGPEAIIPEITLVQLHGTIVGTFDSASNQRSQIERSSNSPWRS